jgi:hypothetical protein
MERFDSIYDSLSGVYSELESMMGSIYGELQIDPTDEKNVNLLQGLGSIALKVISSQKGLVESYGDKELRDSLLSNLDAKATALSSALAQDRNKTR